MSDGGSQDNFLWDNEVWALSNSDNSGRSDENQPAKKFSESNNSNCPTPREAEPRVGPSLGKRKRKNGKQPSVEGNDQAAEGKGGAGADHELHIWTERERRKKMRSMFSNLQSLLPQLPPKADKSTIVDEAVNYIRSLQQTLQRLQKQKLEMIRGLTTINYDPSMITPHRLAMDSREAFLADQGSSSQLSSNPNPLGVARFPTSFRTWATPNMVLNVCGDKAHINICCPKKLGLFSAICYFLEKHKLEVVSAHVSSDNYRSLYMIQAQEKNKWLREKLFLSKLGIKLVSDLDGAPYIYIGVHLAEASGAVDHQYPEAFSFDDIFHLATGEMMMYMSSL